MISTENFYDHLPLVDRFQLMVDPENYHAVPSDWWVGCADIVGSSKAIEAGAYKAVNTVGAAVISAQINAFAGRRFPYAFGGDGAVFAVPPSQSQSASDTLAATRRWARDAFDMELRVAIMPVNLLHAHGQWLMVARFKVSEGLDYAMFHGGGMTWAEARMKEGWQTVPESTDDRAPDLTGLSCRWMPMKARNGKILSMIITPHQDAPHEDIQAVYHDIIGISESLGRGGHPVPEGGPGFRWPPENLDIELQTRPKGRSSWMHRVLLQLQTLVALLLFRTGWEIAGFDPNHYIDLLVQNADFRKFDDDLKMTLDCDDKTMDRIRARLDQAQREGLLDYGLHTQDEALMTCVVPSLTQDDHIHFIDGASGGYTAAAAKIRQT